jgi:hypothetical protein
VSVTPLSVNLGDPFLKCTLDARAEPAVRATNKKPVTKTTPILANDSWSPHLNLSLISRMNELAGRVRSRLTSQEAIGNSHPIHALMPAAFGSMLWEDRRPRVFTVGQVPVAAMVA